MYVSILDNRQSYIYKLDCNIDHNGIHIRLNSGIYYISLDQNLLFTDSTKVKRLEYKEYEIESNEYFYHIYIHIYENIDGIDDYQIYRKNDFLISGNINANIISKNIYNQKYYVLYKDGYIKTNYPYLSINNKQYKEEIIHEGDVLDYFGLRIIFYNDFLYINNFNVDIKIDLYKINEQIIKYNNFDYKNEYYIPDRIKQIEIEEIRKFDYVETKKESIIKTLLASIVMSISMAMISSINYYNSLDSEQSNIQAITYLIMPISMIISGIIVPIILNVIENKKNKKTELEKINEYIEYLNEYEDRLIDRINKHVTQANTHYFSLINAKNKLFYASTNSDDYLLLSIGKVTKTIDIKIEYTKFNEINTRLDRISNYLNNIENYPLFLDLKENKIVTIITKKDSKDFFFKKTLLELSYKHHFDDIHIAVYIKSHHLYDDFYNLPHLFINDKRLTLDCESDLQLLDQMILDKPLILLMYDFIDYRFNNKDIYVIYFSIYNRDLYKNSNAVIEYLNNYGYLYLKDKVKFSYLIEDIDFKEAFSYIGRLKNSNTSSELKLNQNINIYNNYLNNKVGLKADFAYKNNELINFDLHESKHGPHGLIGGTTGSGKSELITSLLLSLCIRYSPMYLNIILIDYKGGGLLESLSINNQSLPHIIASVSNLENNTLGRLIIAISNECNRRQLLFKQLSNITHKSIVNIDSYLENYDYKYGLSSLAHLLIVVDEFAQLKKNNPDVIKELISLSRIGRSLGLHLILATQKPNGVIDDEIWSNSRFKIALRFFDDKDSNDLIKSNDATKLSRPGQFLLKVDNSLIEADSIYTKSDINNNDAFHVYLLNKDLSIYCDYKKENSALYSYADYYCAKIINTCIKMNMNTNKLVFLAPSKKYRKQIYVENKLIIGQKDDYINVDYTVLSYCLDDSLLIYSSRVLEINNLINNLMENNRKAIVIASNRMKNRIVTDSLIYDEKDDICFLFEMLLNNKIETTLLIEDINCFISYEEIYSEYLYKLIQRQNGAKYNLIFITRNAQLPLKIINGFKRRILININDNSDLLNFYNMKSKYIGNSFYFDTEPISFVPCLIEDIIESKSIYNKQIKQIPDLICADRNYLLGYDINNREPIYFDGDLLITSFVEELIKPYLRYKDKYLVTIYENNLYKKNYRNILWLGQGIFEQRLFIANNKTDLNDDEGILIINNRKTIIRIVRHE